ncbi:MAG: hypothetical protein HEP71_19400 [Roseivirga sp.]|nr:hypothetical protein [Roseivirga sp.]
MVIVDLLSLGMTLADLKVFLVLIPLLIGLRALPIKDKRLKAFFYFIVLGAVIVVAGYFTRKIGNNVYLSYIYAPLEIIFVTYILFPKSDSKLIKGLVLSLAGIGIALNFIEAFVADGGVELFNSLTYIVVCILLGSLAIRKLLSLRFDNMIDDLISEPMFWIAISVAIYQFGTLIIWAFFRTVQIAGDDTLLIMAFTRIIISYLNILLQSIALWKVKKNNSRNITNLAT